MKTQRLLIVTLCVLAIGSGGFFAIEERLHSPRSKSVRTSQPMLAAEGVVVPASDETELAAPITGTIETIAVINGQHVVKGQLIAELRSDDLDAQLRSAQGELRARNAELGKLEHGARVEERDEAAAVDRGAKADAGIAATRLARVAALAERGFASRASLDEARYGVASALARRDQAAQRLTLINAPPRSEDLRIARANVRVAADQVDNASAQRAKAFVRAPVAGTILSIPARIGEATSVLSPTIIATMGDISVLHVDTEIDEADVGKVHVGQSARVTADAYPGVIFGGSVIRVSDRMTRRSVSSADPQAMQDALTLKVTIELTAGARLPVGLRCEVAIEPMRRLLSRGG